MTRHLRRLLPDILLIGGLAAALSGAYLITPAAALLMFGVALTGFAIWMTPK